MSEISNKAIMIAVSLLVTIAITSSIIAVMGYFKDIYAQVEKTDISLRKKFTEYDMYDNTVMTGLDMENAYYKYKNNISVEIRENQKKIEIEYRENKEGKLDFYFGGIKKTEEQRQNFYATKYDVTCERIDDGAIITFTKIVK